MSAILNILVSLGLNKTIVPQFLIFIVTYIFLNIFVFKPYMLAYLERRKRTVGSQDVNKQIVAEIAVKEGEYSREAKEINGKIKAIFDEKRSLAQKETQKIVAEAQAQAQEKLNAGKKELNEVYSKAKEQIKTFVPDLGQTIKQRLMDR